jgi:subtilisin family serine protease
MKPIARFTAPRAAFPSVVRAQLARHLGFGSFVILSTLALASRASAAEINRCGDGRSIPNHYIVRAASGASSSSSVSQKSSVSLLEQLVLEKPSRLIHRETHTPREIESRSAQQLTEKSTAEVVSTIASELSPQQISQLTSDESVLSIEEDCLVEVENALLADDPVPANSLRAQAQLNLPEAWSITTNSSPIIIAVSDTGVDLKHEDLAANLWTNTSEVNGLAEVDDDGNGCIDDFHGCDFGDYDGDPSPPATAQGGHGTHVAGIIGAVGNNSRGVTGVAWRTQLLVAKGFDSGGSAAISDLLNTIYYSINNGARVINCSWGADRAPTQAERDAFQFALDSGVLAVVAAGNSSQDASHSSPAALDSVLTVGSVNSQNQVSAFSNFGSHVHVYAPGGDAGANNEYIYSTLPGNKYGPLRGTSMAAPFVTGIAALVFSINPKLSAVDVRDIIVSSSQTVSSRLPDGSTSLIRIPDAAAALKLAATYTPTPFGVASHPASSIYQAPKSSAGAPEIVNTSSTTSCALHRSGEPHPWQILFLLLPIVSAFALKRRASSELE